MKAHKFYDKENKGFELFLNEEKESIMMAICEDPNTVLTNENNVTFLEFDKADIDDILISLADLKNELT